MSEGQKVFLSMSTVSTILDVALFEEFSGYWDSGEADEVIPAFPPFPDIGTQETTNDAR